jgi:hypothetical protein
VEINNNLKVSYAARNDRSGGCPCQVGINLSSLLIDPAGYCKEQSNYPVLLLTPSSLTGTSSSCLSVLVAKQPKEKGRSFEQPLNYFAFFSAVFSAFGAATFVAGFAALVFPKDPAKILPFFVLISPRPILLLFYFLKL